MSVPEQNMRTLMEWLSDDVTGASPGAKEVTEDLAMHVFLGEVEWPDYQDRAARYAQDISAWLTGGTESQFIALTAEGGDPAAFISWMMPVLDQWKASAAHDEAGRDGQGLANPNYESDPTPGTQYYRYDAATGEYLYSATADGSAGWAAYEQRRYVEPAWDDSYGLSYRYDKRDEVYEWYDEQNGTWNNQAWADQYAARAAAAGAGSPAVSAAAWDEKWQMFYRIGPDGQYQYADAVVPGDESSGSSGAWLSYEQVMTRPAPEPAAVGQGGQETAQSADAGLSDEDIRSLLGDALTEQGSGQQTPEPADAEVTDEDIDSIAGDALKEHPEIADMPEEERMRAISEVLDELKAG